MQPSPTPDEDLPLDPPPPYTAHPSDLTGCGPVEDISYSSDMDCDPASTEEVGELFSNEDVTLPLLPPEKKEEDILTTAIRTAQM